MPLASFGDPAFGLICQDTRRLSHSYLTTPSSGKGAVDICPSTFAGACGQVDGAARYASPAVPGEENREERRRMSQLDADVERSGYAEGSSKLCPVMNTTHLVQQTEKS